MSTIDYEKLTEIVVKSQEEFGMIPDNFQGRIYIEFGTPWNRATINRAFVCSVVARENSSVVACENSSVVACENSSVVAWGNSSVEARENSSVVARENSSVEACENSSVEAAGNTQVVNYQPTDARIKIMGNARIVYNPKAIEEYMSFYGIKHDKKTGRFFKAVRRWDDGTYHSDHDSKFCYVIGETVKEKCDPDIEEDCSYGIHMSHLAWALSYGDGWKNIAILELESDLDKIIVPVSGCGKVRTSEAKVIREVPLEECGVYGKILAKRLAQRRT